MAIVIAFIYVDALKLTSDLFYWLANTMTIGSGSMNSTDACSAAKIFSAKVFREMAKDGRSPTFVCMLEQARFVDYFSPAAKVSDIYEHIYSLLDEKNYRNEYFYKSVITKKILLGVHSLNTAVMLSEYRVSNSKADLVIFNGTSTVYEIKSERDKLERLEGQLESYLQVFAKVNVIAGEKHVDSILSLVNPEVGVLMVNSRNQITTIRESIENKSRIRQDILFESLKRAEQIDVLKKLNITIPNLPNMRLHSAMRDLFMSIEPNVLHDYCVDVLKKSRSLIKLKDFTANIPSSLHAIALTIKLNAREQVNILKAINTCFYDAQKWR